ncbi:MAG: DUF2080 family transposase-associated protein [Opitutaceae bacterium]|nr:DUF2080 family transposase-associated protein [Cytophagales bacterium]
MIKTIVTPHSNSYNLTIPQNYIGKKIEILIYAIDEPIEQKPTVLKKGISELWGSLSDKTAYEIQKHVNESRNNWSDDNSK